MEIRVLETAGKSREATLCAGGGKQWPPLCWAMEGHGHQSPHPEPVCPLLSPPEGTMTKVCLLKALAETQTMLCQMVFSHIQNGQT